MEKRRRGGGEGGWLAPWPEDAASVLLLHHVALDLVGVGGGEPPSFIFLPKLPWYPKLISVLKLS
jgi:hypothetical protein